MNEDTEYKDAFDAAAQPAVETAEEPSFAGPKQILRTEPRSSKPTLPTTRPQRRMSPRPRWTRWASSHRQRPDSAHTRRAPQTQLEAGRTWPTNSGASSIRSPRQSAGNDLPRLSLHR